MRGRPAKNRIPEDQYEEVGKMYQQLNSIKDIATVFWTTDYMVRKVLFELEIPLRPRGRPRIGG